ncbi:HAD-IA family hydrolase [Propylenella binzhouense]|uniref:HAD family hydrolase n=1 Tax=Propylenella binzhouense TaxID=2555902 RepID=A0A964WV13_9HYPH|nr:HAD-IA family hydrolase [Propylenella binzhouense]MYZ49594.1 HAD family hydrolase [Propylenella binzhouense]
MKLVLFDCDGTIVDSQHIIAEAMALAFAEHRLPPPPPEATRLIIGLSLPLAIAELLDEPAGARTEAIAESYRRQFLAMRSRPDFFEPLFPGAAEALRALAARDDLRLGMVTGKSRRGVAAVCEKHGFEGLFEVVRTADDCPSKPHPAMVLECCAEAGLAPADAIVVGDTRFDMEMARASGADPVGVSWGYHKADDLRLTGARCIVDDFDALVAEVLRTGGPERMAAHAG